jgi:hypothetical protein
MKQNAIGKGRLLPDSEKDGKGKGAKRDAEADAPEESNDKICHLCLQLK